MSAAEVRQLLERIQHAEQKAEKAAEIAMAAVATVKHQQRAAEYNHAKEAEQLAAMKQMVATVEALSRHILG